MNVLRFETYDETIQADVQAVIKLWQASAPGAAKYLNRLRRKAKEDKDNNLLGFVYFHYADLYYYREPNYDLFKKNIANAIRTLMRSEDSTLLARSYNFVGFDAVNHGSYDVAYNYYMTCLKIAEEKPDSLPVGIACANLGQMFNELGSYDLARHYARRGISIIRKHPEDGKYLRNLINMHFQDGMISLAMNRFHDVEKTRETIIRLMKKFEASDEGLLEIPLAFINVRVALGHGNTIEANRYMDDLVDALVNEPSLFDAIDDVFTFLHYLIAQRQLDFASRVIKAISKKIDECDVTNIKLLFIDILISYFEAKDNPRQVTRLLHEQHALSRKLRADQKAVYRFSIDLIRIIADIQEEQEKIRKENEVLQVQAQTDALTGVPNRHAMNKELVAAFERAYQNRTILGVEILDIDSFKEYNDTYGHRMGDVCLEIIAKELMRLAKDKHVFCARYGGDEFVIIYEGLSEIEIHKKAQLLSEKIIARKIQHANSKIGPYVTISQGICFGVPKNKNKLWDFLENADAALYAIKKGAGKKEDSGIRMLQIPESFS